MLQGESHVSRDPILLLGNIIYAPCHVSLNVRIKVKKKTQYNSSYCELGPPVFTLKWKLEFTDNFGSHFISRGLTNHSESRIQLWSTTVHYQEAALDPQSVIKTRLQSTHTDRHVIRGCWRKEKIFTRKFWEDSALPEIPFWGHLNIDLCFSYLF